jgi:hypothetical protein
MRVDYIRIISIGAGHWRVIVERYNYSPKTRITTSTTRWTVVTTDSMSIDDYKSEDEKRYKRGEKRLIWQAKTWGTKELIR